jgi:quercetin 2,3-dioxygenase
MSTSETSNTNLISGSSVRQVVALPASGPWPTIDPFLFCVHHLDNYPAGKADLTPAAPLNGRNIGNDFANVNGWNMYHGSGVPGFPKHPHRGFETLTYVRHGFCDHSDSLGAQARFGRGDVQWMTAGRGIQHCEMFPLLSETEPNPLELFQIWINLPSADKMVDPYFTMLWDESIPRVMLAPGVTITVIAGRLEDATPASPPPDSWGSRPEADLAVWHIVSEAGTSVSLPPAATPETTRTLYVFGTSDIEIDGIVIRARHAALVDPTQPLTLSTPVGSGSSDVLLLQGRSIDEPVAQHGPFVMNTESEIRQAFADYQRTQFGGWPWETDDPNHGHSADRFAVHPDGRKEQPIP